MTRQKQLTTFSIILLTLIAGALPNAARADGGDTGRGSTVRLYATAEVGPIGTIDSTGPLTINGRETYGRQDIWDGELLQASASACALVRLDAVSQVTLMRGAMVRLATARARRGDHASRRVLVATLIQGEVAVTLQPEAEAFVQAGGVRYTTTGGAKFRLAVRDGQPALAVASGSVEAESQNEARSLNHVAANPADPNGQPLILDGSLSVEARSSRQVQFRVTDANDKPIPDLPIVLTLATTAGKSVGVFSGGATTVTTTTNAQGIASASFTAGPSQASGTLTANVPGTGLTKTINVKVEKPFWTKTKMSLAGAGGVAALIVVIVHPSPGPLRQVAPSQIVP